MKKHSLLIWCICVSGVLQAQKKLPQKSIFRDSTALMKILNTDGVWPKRIFLGYSKTNTHPMYAYYYNRGGTDKAMIMAGVHGSEFYGVDVVDSLKARLDTMTASSFKWKIIILPKLFPENVDSSRNYGMGERHLNYQRCTKQVWKKVDGKYQWACEGVDPNRQMPKAGISYKNGSKGAKGHAIERENQYLLQLVQAYNPSRIASVHCKNEGRFWEIGIYADPRTYNDSIALGFSEDSALAVNMAVVVAENGGRIIGNFHKKIEDGPVVERRSSNAIYPQDPLSVFEGQVQKRNSDDSLYKGKVSFGTWASTRIDTSGLVLKNAATTITIELPQFYSFADPKNKRYPITTNTNAYVKSLLEVFLSNQ